MKKKAKLTLIIALLIAVIAVSFGVLRISKERHRQDADRDGAPASEQADSGNGGAGEEGDGLSGKGSDVTAGDAAEEDGQPLATLFFASDYQAEPGFEEPSITLGKILDAAKADGKSIDKVIMCGDYTNDRKLHDYQLSPDEAIEEIRSVISAECPGVKSDGGDGGNGAGSDGNDAASDAGDGDGADAKAGEGIIFVQGNHDRMTEEITPTGLYEFDDYLIYVLNTEDDFPWKQGKMPGCLDKVRRSSAAMEECFDELIRKGETRPVFIAGHVPLHFTARTSSRHTTGDNLYSSLVFDVVNDAAESLDIVYLFGHDHSKGWDCYLGGSSVYKAKGDKILIPRFEEDKVNTDEYSEETLRFTYLNTGYCGYYMNCGPEELDAGISGEYSAADEALTGTVFEIYADRIAVTRYDTGGAHVLGHKGEADPYKGGIDAGLIPEESYSGETKSPQVIY